MNTTDTIALLALAVSLVSFWLSYRSARESKRLSAAERISGAHLQMLDVLLKTKDMLLFAKAASARNDRDDTQRERLNLLIDVLETTSEQARQAVENLSNTSECDPTSIEKKLRVVSEVAAYSSSIVDRFEKLKVDGFVLAEPPARFQNGSWTIGRDV